MLLSVAAAGGLSMGGIDAENVEGYRGGWENCNLIGSCWVSAEI